MNGALLSVEGADGCGKSTHIGFIAQWLRERGAAVLCTREPGGTAVGESLRQILLHAAATPIADRCELLLMFAARAQHLDEVIVPALAAGKWVLCDRFIDATYAYQGGGRGIAAQDIEILEQWTHRAVQPDLTVLLDAPVEVAAARTRQRGGKPDRFEGQQADFKQAVRRVYQARAARFPQRIRVLDAKQPMAQVRAELNTVLATFWQQRQRAHEH